MIHIKEKIKVTRIYLVTNCYGDPNKVYIGKTINSRKNDHKSVYGSQITYDYIDEINSLNHTDWKQLECFWIEQFRQWGFEIVNKNGGGSGPSFQSKEVKEKISISSKGKKFSKEHKRKIKQSRKNRKYSENSKLKMSNSKKGKNKTKEHCNNISKAKKGKKLTKKHNLALVKGRTKPIIQCDLEGNERKEWIGAKKASIKLKIGYTNINNCCKGKQKTAGGYIWKYKINL